MGVLGNNLRQRRRLRIVFGVFANAREWEGAEFIVGGSPPAEVRLGRSAATGSMARWRK